MVAYSGRTKQLEFTGQRTGEERITLEKRERRTLERAETLSMCPGALVEHVCEELPKAREQLLQRNCDDTIPKGFIGLDTIH